MALDPNRLLENLGGDIRNIGASFLAGQNNALAQAQARQSLAINDFRLQQAQHQEQRDQQFQTDLNAYYQNPTLDGLARLAARYPEQAEALKQTYQVMDQQQRQSRVLQFGSLMNAAANGRVDLVKRQVQSIRDAEAAKGMDTSEADDLLNRLNNGDTTALNQVKGFAQLHLAAIDPAKFPLPGANVEGKVVGNSIGHYEGNQWVVDYQAPEKPQYRTVDVFNDAGDKIGTKLIRIGGNAEGGGPASGGSGAYSGNAPRSVRNNNPGNLKASPFTKSLPGYQGRDKDGFAIFDSPQSGASAQAALLGNYMDRGYNTVAKIISRWAPKSDGNDTAAYVKTVAKQLGVNPSDTLSKDMIPRLQSAISTVEGGANNPSNSSTGSNGGTDVIYQSMGSATGGAGGMSDPAINNAAAVYNATGNLPTRISQKDKESILNRAAALSNGDVGSMLAGWGSRKAASKALGDLQSLSSKVEAFESTALRNGALALRLGASVGNDGLHLFNAWINAGRRATGDPKVRAFDAALKTFANEFAKVTSSATGGGVTSDAARAEAQSMINGADTVEQLIAVMQTLTQDMNNRRKGLEGQRRQLLKAISGGVSSRQAPSGFRIVAINGKPVQ